MEGPNRPKTRVVHHQMADEQKSKPRCFFVPGPGATGRPSRS